MAAGPIIQLVPRDVAQPKQLYTAADLPMQQARVNISERWRTNDRWGDLEAPTLASVLSRAAKGDVSDWADLCEYAIGSDDHLGSLYDTRISRVAQADYVIGPNPLGDQRLATELSDFVNEQMLRIGNWHEAMRDLLHAVFVGFACGESEWDQDCASMPTGGSTTNYVRKIHHRHGHRFRYDEQWELRLYDRGEKSSKASQYGVALDPRLWIVHHHRMQAGYPGIGGILRSGIWRWMFRRWLDKLWTGGLERHGAPILIAKVNPNTPRSTRLQILEQLKNMIAEHVGVVEEEGAVTALTEAVQSFEGYEKYMDYSDRSLTKLILGASDITEPGTHGSQSAVDTRAGITTDPRMVTDGRNLADTLHATLFKQLVAMNMHKWPGRELAQMPIPVMRFKTADDEVEQDPSAKVEEVRAEAGAQDPSKPGSLIELQPQKSAGKASSGDLLEIMKSLQLKQVSADMACDLLMLGGVEADRAHRMCGLPIMTETAVRAATPDPKAVAPVRPGRQATKTRGTSGRSRSLTATGLRSGSGASASSSSKRPPQQLKL